MMLQDALAWTALGDVYHAMSSLEDAVEAYGRAVATHNMAAPPEVPALKTLVRLGGLFLQLSKVDAAKDIFLQGAGAWQCCSMWLGAGIALLRLERFGDSDGGDPYKNCDTAGVPERPRPREPGPPRAGAAGCPSGFPPAGGCCL